MDENHQDKTGNNLTATRNTLWLPPLLLKDQKKLKHLQKKPFAVRTGLKGKTLWDWLQLLGVLAIPLVVAGATLLFGIQQARLAQQQHEADKQSALDQQEATILQTYIDNIQDLLLNHNLLKSKPTDGVAILARARTLTALRGLDPERQGYLVQFIYEARLIGYYDHTTNKLLNSIINLTDADLSFGTDLSSGADLTDTILSGADLTGANLSGADLYHADLYHADLVGASLYGTYLTGADLSGADLSGAGLGYIEPGNLYANLSGANLSGANLSGANLYGADLVDAILSSADLSGATLTDATVTQQQLDQVRSCKNTILPPGLTCHHNL